VNKQTATAAATVTAKQAQAELAEMGTAQTHTYYGRGFVPSDAEQIGNVLIAFRAAHAAADGRPVAFCVDEDAFFAVHGVADPEYVADFLVNDAAGEDAALLLWWDYYGRYDSPENNPTIRKSVANTLGVPAQHLEDYEG
jgi:hypothetical protein